MEYIALEFCIIFYIMILFALIGITCCVIDAVINVKQYKHWKEHYAQEKLSQQVGEIINAKIKPGGGI